MKSKAEVRKVASSEVPIADYIPLGVHMTPNLIKLRNNGEYVAIWRLDGVTFETIEPADLNVRKEQINNFLRSLGGGQYALWSHKVRRVRKDRLPGEFKNDFCRTVDQKYNATFNDYRMLETALYLTIVYRPTPSNVPNVLAKLFKRMTVRTLEDIRKREQECFDKMDDIAKEVEVTLSRFGPERLATFEQNGVVYSQMLAFLGYLVNGVWEEIPLRRAPLNEYLPSSRLFFGDKNGLLQIEHKMHETKFVGFIDFQEYAPFSETGMNNGVLYGDFEYIETQSFSILNKLDAVKEIERQRNQLISGEEASATEIAEMDAAVDQVRNGQLDMGEYHYTLAVFGENIDRVTKNMADARGGFPLFKMAVVDVVPECAWLAQLPGNWDWRPRQAQITSLNFACLSPLHNFASGKRDKNPWGQAITLLKTPSGQPFYFNFHYSPEDQDSTDDKLPGNCTVLGMTGVGKTTLMAFLLSQMDKFSPGVVWFDKDRGMEIAIRAMRGKYTNFRRGERTGINPFQWEDSPAVRALCTRVVARCVTMEGIPITPREMQDIYDAVKTVFEQLPHHLRRLAAVDQNLPNVGDTSLGLRLKKWVGNGSLGWVIDNPVDTLDLASNRLQGFDYTEFLDDPEIRTVVMMLLLFAAEGMIDGTPFMYCMEEFWKPLLDETFRDWSRDNQKTIRKKNGIGTFITQSPSDVLLSPIGKTMVEQSATLVLLPNPKADEDDYVNGFKLTRQEFKVVKGLAEDGRIFMVKQGGRSALVKLDLGALRDEIVVLSGSEDNVKLLDLIRDEVGDDPDVWMPILLERARARRALAKGGAQAPSLTVVT